MSLARLTEDRSLSNLQWMPLDTTHVSGRQFNLVSDWSNAVFLTPAEHFARTQAYLPTQHQQGKSEGLMAAFTAVCSRWRIATPDMALLLGYLPEYSRSVLSVLDSVPQTRDMVDRVAYLNIISLGLGALFNESTESEVKWLNTPKDELRGETPLDHMRRGHMHNVIAVKNLVSRERGI